MAVHVDNMRASYRGMIMCHMVADCTEELLAMADAIGVKRKWLQDAGTYREHFDISRSKRALAIRRGAVEIEWVELARLLQRRRERFQERMTG